MSQGPAADSRHLEIAGLRAYLEAGNTGRLRVAGEPESYLIINPAERRLSIQVVVDGALPNCTRYENVDAVTIKQGGSTWNQLSVFSDHLEDLYPLLILILDRVQLGKQQFRPAVGDILNAYGSVLSQRSGLPLEKQLGLFGELLVLRHLLQSGTTPERSEKTVGTWLGPTQAEHDFVLHHSDLEVKTTTAEQRQHWISSLSQLVPTVGRDLHLLSLQITSAGTDGGESLPELVEGIRHLSEMTTSAVSAFDAKLHGNGYHDQDQELYTGRWRLRTNPAIFLIDDAFPTLRKTEPPAPEWEHIVEARYLLDLTHLSTCGVPHALAGFTEPTPSGGPVVDGEPEPCRDQKGTK